MAQREEEAELRVPETTVTLCANNCGFHGNPATKNMCQTCFQAAGPPSCSVLPRSGPVRVIDRVEGAGEAVAGPVAAMIEGQPEPAAAREVKRCAGCRKKVGLAGFRCRCGELFCSKHRYSDRHVCSYDYKAAAREAIARENPVVRAAKIVRI